MACHDTSCILGCTNFNVSITLTTVGGRRCDQGGGKRRSFDSRAHVKTFLRVTSDEFLVKEYHRTGGILLDLTESPPAGWHDESGVSFETQQEHKVMYHVETKGNEMMRPLIEIEMYSPVKLTNKTHKLAVVVEVFGQDTSLHGTSVADDEFVSCREPF